jgi:hypothetical protein
LIVATQILIFLACFVDVITWPLALSSTKGMESNLFSFPDIAN